MIFEYIIRSKNRDKLERYLLNKNIECKVRYKYLMPEQPAYKHLPFNDLTIANEIKKEVLSLPCHEKMTMEEARYVVKSVINFFKIRKK